MIPDSLINIEEFVLFRNDGAGKRGGGTCLYIRNSLKVACEKESLNNKDIEIQECTILGNGEYQKQIAVILVYRPPHGSSNVAFEILKQFITDLPDLEKKELIIMGDFNWNYNNQKCTGYSWINRITDEFEIIQHIKIPT